MSVFVVGQGTANRPEMKAGLEISQAVLMALKEKASELDAEVGDVMLGMVLAMTSAAKLHDVPVHVLMHNLSEMVPHIYDNLEVQTHADVEGNA